MVTELNESNFDSFVESNHIAIIDCWAPWCGPCRRMGPIVEELANDLAGKAGVAKLNTDENQAIAIRFNINAIPTLRERLGDRAVLRAMHFFDENRRVLEQVQALKNGDFEGFLAGVRASGRSSWMLLQNIIPLGSTAHQQMALAQALCEKLLDGRGACRVHGGGFAGTILAFVPDEMLGQFRSGAEAVLGAGSCHVLSIRQTGGTRLG